MKLLIKAAAGMVLAMAAAGCADVKTWRYAASQDEEAPVYVVSHGWHTGIVVANANLGTDLAFLRTFLGISPYYEIGWGDKAFYRTPKVTPGIALKAALWPTDSVLHVAALPAAPDQHFPRAETLKVPLSKTGHARLNAAISQSFRRGEGGGVAALGKGLYGHSLFFDSVGRFHIFNTCNTWTARMLDQAGVPVRTFLTLTAGSVMAQVEKALAAAAQEAAAGPAPACATMPAGTP
ncbi:MAG: DUF2459 domain-containing protein [Pseudomonadota bacterium]|nr:DUF2459 domain-containing protein [Pseudomonadota bacterium]